MKIMISPAKKMRIDTDTLKVKDTPYFLKDAEYLRDSLKELSYREAKALWNCNDAIASLNFERLKTMDLKENLTPALLAYEGIQYQYMAPSVLADGQWEYVQEHVNILSGFYGIVRPLDGVVPYRLEMQAKIQLPYTKNLYDFWGERLYRRMAADTGIILNLASKEYSKCIEAYADKDIRYITCVFGECKGDRIIEKGTYAKMARGEMIRYMAEHHITDIENIKNFDRLGYIFSDQHSDHKKITFIKKNGA